jgi:hypothetical protein
MLSTKLLSKYKKEESDAVKKTKTANKGKRGKPHKSAHGITNANKGRMKNVPTR